MIREEDDWRFKIFGYYSPKATPDTAFDYLEQVEGGGECVKILMELLTAEIKHLEKLLVLFDEYSEKAKINPGRYREGNLLLGAPIREYAPSGDELILAEIGNRVKSIVEATQEAELKEYLEQQKITRKEIEYNHFTFIHYDVMGSGRFFYASDPVKEKVTF